MAVLGTFSAGQVLTAAELNQFNNVTALYGSTTSCVSGSITPIEYTSAGQVVTDVSNWHDTATNPSRITVDKNGVYLIGGAMQIAYNSGANIFFTNIMRNGTVMIDVGCVQGYYPSNTVTAVLSASAGDYFEMGLYQNTGASVGMWAGRNSFYVVLLRTT